MKAVKYLLVVLVRLFLLPFSVWAEGEEEAVVTAAPAKVSIYLFRGEGCPHCAEAEAYFDSMKEQYGEQFRVYDFEVWYDKENSALMETVASARGQEVDGVPYILIGDKSWNGFNEELGAEMMAEVTASYSVSPEERYDLANYVPELAEAVKNFGEEKETEKKESNDAVALLIVLLVTGAICFGVYKARKAVK